MAFAFNATTVVEKNVTFHVYALSDTSFSTPLAINDANGNPVSGNSLTSSSQGVVPAFQQDTNQDVMLADAGHTRVFTLVSSSTVVSHTQIGLAGSGARVWSGTGVPATPGGSISYKLGDIFLRTDTPSTANQRVYIVTTAGTSPTWTGIL